MEPMPQSFLVLDTEQYGIYYTYTSTPILTPKWLVTAKYRISSNYNHTR